MVNPLLHGMVDIYISVLLSSLLNLQNILLHLFVLSFMQYSGILEPHETAKVSHDKQRDAYDVATVAEIDCIVKKYADNLLHALEGVGSRLSQLESRTRYLEGCVDELKVSVGNNHGSTDGKLRQLENILREVCVL